MNFARRKLDAMGGKARACGLLLALCSLPLVGYAAEPLKPGPNAGNTVYLESARDYAFCEIHFVMGQPPNLALEVYNTSGIVACTPAKFGPVDADALAKQFGAIKVIKNPTRHWLMDKMWLYDAGETRNFDGIKATWMAKIEMKGAKPGGDHGKPFAAYEPMTPSRHSKFVWNKGSEVYMLRDPDRHAWLMQAYTNLVDKDLTLGGLATMGSKLKLPPGWKYEVKTLDRELTYIPPKSTGYLTHAVADDLANVYQGCGFDDACNYNP